MRRGGGCADLREEQAPPLPRENGVCARRGRLCGIWVRLALSVSRCEPPVSLRLGHARGLTAVQAVIQHPRAAALPVSGRLTVASLPKVGNLFCVQTEVPTRKADSRGRLSLQKNKLRTGSPCAHFYTMGNCVINLAVFALFECENASTGEPTPAGVTRFYITIFFVLKSIFLLS